MIAACSGVFLRIVFFSDSDTETLFFATGFLKGLSSPLTSDSRTFTVFVFSPAAVCITAVFISNPLRRIFPSDDLYGKPSGDCVLHSLMGVSPPVLTRRLFVKKYHYPQTCHRHIRSNPIFTALDSRECVHAARLISLINVPDDLTIQFSKFRDVFSVIRRSLH